MDDARSYTRVEEIARSLDQRAAELRALSLLMSDTPANADKVEEIAKELDRQALALREIAAEIEQMKD